MDLGQLKRMINGRLIENEMMANHTSYGIGGPARAFIEPKSIKDLQIIKSFALESNLDIFCLGSGSNLLVSNSGINGLVINLEKHFKKLLFNKNKCYAESGIKLSKLVKECIKNGLGGMETMIGIPGTLGGALVMNAGAYDQEISKYLTAVEIFNGNDVVERISSSDINFGYRTSSFKKTDIIIRAEFNLQPLEKEELIERKDTANEKRKSTQPLKYRSAGSVFKNPTNGDPAGYLIDQAGLKGFSIGGAKVSEIHANFIVNDKNATADDMVQLIKFVRKTIREKYSVELDLEIKTIGFAEGTFNA